MKKENGIFLKHILEAIANIEYYVDGYSYEDFLSSKKTQDAVIRNFEIIGEAANNLDKTFMQNHHSVVWDEVISMRNFLIHQYFSVDLKIVWDTIQEDLTMFKKKITLLVEQN